MKVKVVQESMAFLDVQSVADAIAGDADGFADLMVAIFSPPKSNDNPLGQCRVNMDDFATALLKRRSGGITPLFDLIDTVRYRATRGGG